MTPEEMNNEAAGQQQQRTVQQPSSSSNSLLYQALSNNPAEEEAYEPLPRFQGWGTDEIDWDAIPTPEIQQDTTTPLPPGWPQPEAIPVSEAALSGGNVGPLAKPVDINQWTGTWYTPEEEQEEEEEAKRKREAATPPIVFTTEEQDEEAERAEKRGRTVEPVAQTWTCAECSETDIPCTATKCPKCKATRIAGSWGAMMWAQQSSGWKCDGCSVQNKEDATKCPACMAPRFGTETPAATTNTAQAAAAAATTTSFTFGAPKSTSTTTITSSTPSATVSSTTGATSVGGFHFGAPTLAASSESTSSAQQGGTTATANAKAPPAATLQTATTGFTFPGTVSSPSLEEPSFQGSAPAQAKRKKEAAAPPIVFTTDEQDAEAERTHRRRRTVEPAAETWTCTKCSEKDIPSTVTKCPQCNDATRRAGNWGAMMLAKQAPRKETEME